jgi:hypothetical protein
MSKRRECRGADHIKSKSPDECRESRVPRIAGLLFWTWPFYEKPYGGHSENSASHNQVEDVVMGDSAGGEP